MLNSCYLETIRFLHPRFIIRDHSASSCEGQEMFLKMSLIMVREQKTLAPHSFLQALKQLLF